MKTPGELIEAVTRLNEALQKGEVKDLEMATLLARGHQTVAKCHSNLINAAKVAGKFGMSGKESLRELLTAPTEEPAPEAPRAAEPEAK